MNLVLQCFILLPLAAFLLSFMFPSKREQLLSGWVLSTSALHLLGLLLFLILWILDGAPLLDKRHITFYHTEDIEIFIDLYFDRTTAVFSFIGSIMMLLVSLFSKTYIHRDPGFKRFFVTLLFFFTGYNLVVFSGNFETLFIGWEILGVCSFLLIAFYRDRYLPIKNALKVISIYRIGDICLMLVMWMSHHLWHENITFITLNDTALVANHLLEHQGYGVFIALMIFLAAAAKSAQFPFSYWLPRAMEGPTSSSAIFYGALSVHIGVFLLLRTYPYWESLMIVKVIIVTMGILTTLIASNIASVQSTVKTQIAYASVAQIGLMFVEVALGFHWLALIHFSGNAMLRTYQLLISPSVLSYRIHDMMFHFKPKVESKKNAYFARLYHTFYMLGIQEWNMDHFFSVLLWTPAKKIGRSVSFLSTRFFIILLSFIYLSGLVLNIYRESISIDLIEFLPFVYSVIGLLLLLKAFSFRGNAIASWLSVFSAQLFITLGVVFLNEHFGFTEIGLLLSGSIASALIGYLTLRKVYQIDQDIQLNRFHGYVYEKPILAFIFLLCCLGMIGLPFTPSFVGIDLLFSHIHKHQELVIIFTSISFLFFEISVLRIYARVFLGPHKKEFHPIAFKSS